MGHRRDSSKKRNAETVGAYTVPAIMDAEDDSLRAEFAGLDLTEDEQRVLSNAWRLRRHGAPSADLRASRALFQNLRQMLADALAVTLRYETRPDEMIRAMAVFDREEALRRERIEVAMLRPCTDGELSRLKARIADLDSTARVRRQDVADNVAVGGKVSTMPKSGALRIHSRDGLGTLFEAKRLTARQFNAGRAYRLRHEAVSRGLRSCLGSGGGGATLTTLQIVEAKARLAKWEHERVQVDLAVVRRLKDDPSAVHLLRRVAGEGFSITSQVGNGRANDAGVKLLARALDICALLLPRYA